MIFALLRAADLKPLEFEQARQLTGQASPYVGDILSAAFAYAQAIVVLLIDDERVELRPELLGPREEADQGFQPRPNLILEAGMALEINPNRTVIVEIGDLRQISDLTDRHVVRWADEGVVSRKRLLERLRDSGCSVDMSGEDWMTVVG